MIRLSTVAVAALFLAACTPEQPSPGRATSAWEANNVTVWHDDARAVTCWIFRADRAGGISCTPDWMLTEQVGPSPTYPDGEPCGSNSVCAEFDRRRRALEDAL